jgi:sarcosine oxidase
MIHRSVANVVLGAGAMGSAAAYQLARRSEPVLLVEQFELGHDRGSSHGSARITRHSYADPVYARLMGEAFRAWRELEAEAGVSLYLRTGGVSICPSGLDYVGRVAENLAAINVPHRRMRGSEWNRRQPSFGVDPTDDVVFEPDAGMLLAARAIEIQQAMAREIGGERTEMIERATVRRIDLDGERARLVLDDQVIEAERLIVTAGAWTTRLIPSLTTPLRPTRQQVIYLRPGDPDAFAIGRFPAFIFIGQGELNAYYGMPGCLGSGVKVARHGGLDVDPDRVDRTIEAAYIDDLREFLRRTAPSLADSPIDRTETCLYTMTADETFKLGPLPGRPDVIVASPCSGHGFKFSALIGRVLADLAIDGRTEIDIRPWRLG